MRAGEAMVPVELREVGCGELGDMVGLEGGSISGIERSTNNLLHVAGMKVDAGTKSHVFLMNWMMML